VKTGETTTDDDYMLHGMQLPRGNGDGEDSNRLRKRRQQPPIQLSSPTKSERRNAGFHPHRVLLAGRELNRKIANIAGLDAQHLRPLVLTEVL